MMCRMCLMDSPETLDMFADEKTEYSIAATIAQHFWFEPKYDDMIPNIICNTCWRRIESFHVYYLCVAAAQQKLAARCAVKHEQASVDKPTDDGIKEFIKLEPEDADGVNDTEGRYGGLREGIVFDEEKSLEQNCSFDNKANEYIYCAEEGELDGTESGAFHTELIEEVMSNLWEPMPDQTEQTSLKGIIKIESADSTSKENTIIVDLDDSDDDPRVSNPHRKTDICSTRRIVKRKSRSSEFSLKTKEDDLKIARNIQLKCDLCGASFGTFAEVARHIKTVHGRKGYVKCCNRKWFERGAILGHVNKHLDSDFFKCTECNKTFSDNRCLKNHMLRHELKNTKISPSEIMPRWSSNEYYMNKDNHKGTLAEGRRGNCRKANHLPRDAPSRKLYQCDKCPRRFAKLSVLNQHKMGHILKAPCFSCGICRKSFPSETLFATHQKSVHLPKMCPVCAKVIEGETLFAEHQLEHSEIVDEKIQCEKCGMWLKNPLRLMAHTKKVHCDGKRIKSEHICHICGKLSTSSIGLKSHIRFVHAAKRKFVCSVCGKGFKTGRSLMEHMAFHTGDVLYTCPHCPKTFKSGGNMHSHRKKMHLREWEESRRIRGLQTIKSKQLQITSNFSS